MAFCAHCGASLMDGPFCPSCGKPTRSTVSPTTPVAQPAPAKEHTFYDANDVSVTNSRFIVHGQTFAMSGITSVAFFSVAPKIKRATNSGGYRLAFLHRRLCFTKWRTTGGYRWLHHAGAGGLLVSKQICQSDPWRRSSYAAGEVKALQRKNKQLVLEIVDALNQAIVHRG
jgi:Family of unknown function (DUF6232)